MSRRVSLWLLLFAIGAVGGCIELQAALTGVLAGTGGTSQATGDGGNGSTDGTSSDTVPAVSLTVSNPNPMINEEVVLRCSATSGGTTGLTYAFQPAAPLVDVNNAAGTAVFIASEGDAGAEFSFTCTATNAAGTSNPSSAQSIIPTSTG
ncbi:MAG: hypothetical protein KJ749_08420 [Planctomycetes bacterium]|nr:hypothetical protein [Planctomycetota bacterium]